MAPLAAHASGHLVFAQECCEDCVVQQVTVSSKRMLTCTHGLVPAAQDGLHDHEWHAVWVCPACPPERHCQLHRVQVRVVDAHLRACEDGWVLQRQSLVSAVPLPDTVSAAAALLLEPPRASPAQLHQP